MRITEPRPGLQAWYAYFNGEDEVEITCTVCRGSGELLVTLGDGEQVAVECERCQRHHGFERVARRVAAVRQITISKVITTTETSAEGQTSSLRLLAKGGYDYNIELDRVFATQAEAQAKADELLAAWEADEDHRRDVAQDLVRKHVGFTVGYHLDAAIHAFHDFQYHSRKIVLTAESAPKRQLERVQQVHKVQWALARLLEAMGKVEAAR